MPIDKKRDELSFALDPAGGVPYYRQIILQVEMAISDGRLRPGSRLPTVRGLAVNLEINPNTVARAYQELEQRGVVTTQQGTGTFISDREVDVTSAEREQTLRRLVQSLLSHAAGYGFTIDDVIEYLETIRTERSE
ncbi:MAG: GntR family transcriptional regulator [Spirochaetes bacterium]|jgi:GntR family transcriptional regulator|nr:GntR family transcriptional regulator [Spirochaetota bacterium]